MFGRLLQVDDNGWGGVGYNNPTFKTPTIDRLAAQGLKLTSHYAYKSCGAPQSTASASGLARAASPPRFQQTGSAPVTCTALGTHGPPARVPAPYKSTHACCVTKPVSHPVSPVTPLPNRGAGPSRSALLTGRFPYKCSPGLQCISSPKHVPAPLQQHSAAAFALFSRTHAGG